MLRKILSIAMLLGSFATFAQKQTYDVLTFTFPKGWQQKDAEGGRQLTITDAKTGGYATVLLIKSTVSNASPNDNFNSYWNNIVKATVAVSGEPAMQDAVTSNGWEIVSGHASYTEEANTGTATLLAASGGGQTTAVILMTNTGKYQPDLLAFIGSLELSKVTKQTPANKNTASITGLWADYTVERNAYQQYTTGYLRKEYAFKKDGTYTFRKKNFLSNSTQIYFVSESGTYSVSGNQLTIIPKQGKTQFWNKPKSLKNNEWGSFAKSEHHKLEKVTYTFEIIIDPNYGNSPSLKPGKATVRDGGQFNAPSDPYKFNYAFRESASLIDNPPGGK